MRLECTCTVPLGAPVEPDEYSQKQGSSRKVGAGSKESVEAARTSPNARMPGGGAADPEIKTCLRNGDWLKVGRNCGSSGCEITAICARLSCSMYAQSAADSLGCTGPGTIRPLVPRGKAVGRAV